MGGAFRLSAIGFFIVTLMALMIAIVTDWIVTPFEGTIVLSLACVSIAFYVLSLTDRRDRKQMTERQEQILIWIAGLIAALTIFTVLFALFEHWF